MHSACVSPDTSPGPEESARSILGLFWLFYELDIVGDVIHMQRKRNYTVTETKPRVNPTYKKPCLSFYLPDTWNTHFQASRDTEKCFIWFLEMIYYISVPKQSFLCHHSKGDILVADSTFHLKFRRAAVLTQDERSSVLQRDMQTVHVPALFAPGTPLAAAPL